MGTKKPTDLETRGRNKKHKSNKIKKDIFEHGDDINWACIKEERSICFRNDARVLSLPEYWNLYMALNHYLLLLQSTSLPLIFLGHYIQDSPQGKPKCSRGVILSVLEDLTVSCPLTLSLAFCFFSNIFKSQLLCPKHCLDLLFFCLWICSLSC